MRTINLPIGPDGEDVELPAMWEVCSRCDGEGHHSNPAIDGHGITMEEWLGPDWDDESRERYMSGGYDIPCTECKGERLVLVVDYSKLTPEEEEAVIKHQSDMAADARQREAEQLYGY